MIKRNIDIELKLKPEELAEQFCDMNANEQVEFFNTLGFITSVWEKPLAFQLQAIRDLNRLSTNGKYFIEKLAEYAKDSIV